MEEGEPELQRNSQASIEEPQEQESPEKEAHEVEPPQPRVSHVADTSLVESQVTHQPVKKPAGKD